MSDAQIMRELGKDAGHVPLPVDANGQGPAAARDTVRVVCLEDGQEWPCMVVTRAWFIQQYAAHVKGLGYSSAEATLLTIGFAAGWDARNDRPD